jgi:formate dehydrogenase major subunit
MDDNSPRKPSFSASLSFKTICPYCSIGCMLEIESDKGNMIRSNGTSGLINPDGYSCQYGQQGFRFMNGPNRIKQPLLRVNGSFEPVSWDEAFALIEEKLKGGKPEEKAFFAGARLTNEEQYLIQKFARAAVKTNNIGSFHYLGRGSNYTKLSRANLPFAELVEAKRVYLIGAGISANSEMVGEYINENRKKNGLKVDLLTTENDNSDRRFADNVIHIKSYYHFVKAVNHYLLANNLENEAFIRDLIDNFGEYRGQLMKESWTELAEVSGVENPEIIIQFAVDFNLEKRAVIIFSEKELSGHACAELFNLACITGKHGKAGSGLMLLKEKNNSHGLHDMGIMSNLGPGATDWNDPFQRSTFGFNWGVKELPGGKGCTLHGMREGSFRQLYIFGEDPIGCAINREDVKKMFVDKDFIVVQDYFMTETAALADLVLPAAAAFETGGTYTNTQRVIQKISKSIPSPVEIVSWKQLDTLLNRFGYEPLETVDDVTLEILSLLPKFCTSSKLMLRITETDNFNPMFNYGCDYLGKLFFGEHNSRIQ